MVQKLQKSISRRNFATLAGAGVAAFFVPAWNETIEAAETLTCVASTPTVTEGPYWVDEKLFRSDIRTDPTTGVARAGTPLTLQITVQNLSGSNCSVLAGAMSTSGIAMPRASTRTNPPTTPAAVPAA